MTDPVAEMARALCRSLGGDRIEDFDGEARLYVEALEEQGIVLISVKERDALINRREIP